MTNEHAPVIENDRPHQAVGHLATRAELELPPVYDAFGDMLPVYLSPESPRLVEPKFDQLHGKRTRQRYVEKLLEREQLFQQGKITEGSRVLILHSDIGEKDKIITKESGEKIEVTDYFHSKAEGDEHRHAAEGLKHDIAAIMGHPNELVTLAVATRDTIDEALLDESIGHIIYIGHANSSQLTIDPIYTYNWWETPSLTHLKKSFGVFGCGAHKADRFYPRIGSTFVSPGPEGILYGVPGDYLEEGQPYQFNQLVRHSMTPLEGTPDIR